MDVLGSQEEHVGGNERLEPPDAEEDRDAGMEDRATGEEPPLPPRNPKAKGKEEFKILHDVDHAVVHPHGQIEPRHPPRGWRRPASDETDREHLAGLPVGQAELLPADSQVRDGDLHREQTLRQDADRPPCGPRSPLQADIERERLAASAETEHQHGEEKQPVEGRPELMQRENPIVDIEDERDDRTPPRPRAEREEEERKQQRAVENPGGPQGRRSKEEAKRGQRPDRRLMNALIGKEHRDVRHLERPIEEEKRAEDDAECRKQVRRALATPESVPRDPGAMETLTECAGGGCDCCHRTSVMNSRSVKSG